VTQHGSDVLLPGLYQLGSCAPAVCPDSLAPVPNCVHRVMAQKPGRFVRCFTQGKHSSVNRHILPLPGIEGRSYSPSLYRLGSGNLVCHTSNPTARISGLARGIDDNSRHATPSTGFHSNQPIALSSERTANCRQTNSSSFFSITLTSHVT
jgi:hypothetical protein